MVNPLLPEDVSVSINGSDVTFKVVSYNETGGNKNVALTKTLHRHVKNVRNIPTDWAIGFSGTTTDTTFAEIFSLEEPITVIVGWSGSYTVTYNNAEVLTHNLSMTADDRLVFQSEFIVPFYDNTGSKNRSVV